GDFRYHIHRTYGKPNYLETRDSVILDSTEIRSVALLNLDGSLDKTFRFSGGKAFAGANGPTKGFYHKTGSLKGKTVIYGSFTSFDSEAHGYIVRLNADGTVDKTFNVGKGASYKVESVTYNEMTGEYMMTGDIKNINEINTTKLVMLNTNRTIDDTYKVKAINEDSNTRYALQLEDGFIEVSGDFLSNYGIARTNF